MLLLAYGLLPRRGVKMGSRAVRLAAGLSGLPLLALTLLFLVGLAVSSAPLQVALFLLAVAFTPSLALTLYGLERGVIPSLDARIVARVRVSAFSAITISAGSLLTALIIAAVLADPRRFLSELVSWWGLYRLPLPSWAIAIMGVAIIIMYAASGLLFLVLGAIALADFREVVEVVESSPWSWIPRYSKTDQVLALAFSALLVWVGPFISMESWAKGFLASLSGVLVSSIGALLTALIADHPTGKAVYGRLRRRLKREVTIEVSVEGP